MPVRPTDSVPVPLPQPERGERLLIVAPHMDDETIAAGGRALAALARGAEVSVVFLTAGDCNRSCARVLFRTWSPSADQYLSVGRTRILEAEAAMRALGLPADRVFILGYPDQGLSTMAADRSARIVSPSTGRLHVPYDRALRPGAAHTLDNLVDDLARVIDDVRPTSVIAPVHFDVHPDHQAASSIVTMALTRAAVAPERLGYLVHQSRYIKSFFWRPDSRLTPPAAHASLAWATHDLDDAMLARKDEVLQHYVSQRPYVTLLRNAFVRRNELFYVYAEEHQVFASDSQEAFDEELAVAG
jgi:LmbE family N-acetylglucosaminyl deacetylase